MPPLDREILRAVESGTLSGEELYFVLLGRVSEVCGACADTVDGFVEDSELVPALPSMAELSLAAAVTCDRDVVEAAALLDELLSLAGRDARRAALRADPERFGNAMLVQKLLERSRRELRTSPKRAVELADLASEVASFLPPARYGQVLVGELRLEAEAQAGNACRVIGELPEAERRLEWVLARLEEVADPALIADVLSLVGSLRKDQRRLDEAEVLLEQAQAVFREVADGVGEARVLLKRASARYLAGDPEAAIARVESALALLDRSEDEALWLWARHNMASYLVAAGRALDAQRLVLEELPLYLEHPEPVVHLRLLWLQAQIAHVLEQPEASEAGYRRAREGFLELGMELAASLVTLDLAVLLLERGEAVASRILAQETLAVFEQAGVPWEARRAFERLKAAVEQEVLTAATLRELARLMERSGTLYGLPESKGAAHLDG